jgi:guanylate kinase
MNPSLIAEHLLIIAGPSGVGKSTLIRSLLSQSPSLRLSVSYTTRSPRAGEVHGVDYHFTDRASFERMRDGSAFVEWAEVHGNLYGTTRATIEDTIRRGDDLLFDVDIQGTSSLKAAFPDAWAVLISPPTLTALHDRLVSRATDSPDVIARRLARARWELSQTDLFDYLLINADLSVCALQLQAIYTAMRCRSLRQRPLHPLFDELSPLPITP